MRESQSKDVNPGETGKSPAAAREPGGEDLRFMSAPKTWSKGREDVVATFGGQQITRAQLYDILMRSHGREAFDRILVPLLLRAELKRRNLAVTRAESDKLFQDHIRRFARELGKTVNPEVVLQRNFGMGVRAYKTRVIWMELALKKLVQKDLQISSADLFNHYYANRKKYTKPEEVRAYHILISPFTHATTRDQKGQAAGPKEWNKAFGTALEIQKKINAGADFKIMAMQYSQDKKTAPLGGDLGFFSRLTMVKPLADAAFNLEPGQVSELVKTMYGYHLILVTDHTPERLLAFSMIKEQVRSDYLAYMTKTYSQALLGRLKYEAWKSKRLKVLDPFLQPVQ